MKSNWVENWNSILGFSEKQPGWLIATIVLSYVIVVVIPASAVVMTFLSRKLTADIQARVGPSQVGLFGFLQPIADALKSAQKIGATKMSWKELSWLGVLTMALYSTVAILPLGTSTLLVNTDMSAFLPFWAALIFALAMVLLGFDQNSVPGRIGGIRVVAQALVGSFPALLCVFCAGIEAGGFRWSHFADAQENRWIILSNPFQPIAFLVFVISGLVIFSLPPLNPGLSGIDVAGGVSSNLWGRKLTLFNVGKYYGFFLWSVISVVLFLGAWTLPGSLKGYLIGRESWGWLHVSELAVLMSKTVLLMLLTSWMGRVNARLNVDQVTELAWKILGPLSLVSLIGTALWVGGRNFL
jgi:NADH-quinone oxidoreductase subunit H